MPDFERMAREAEELASGIDSPTERRIFLEVAAIWRSMDPANDPGDAEPLAREAGAGD